MRELNETELEAVTGGLGFMTESDPDATIPEMTQLERWAAQGWVFFLDGESDSSDGGDEIVVVGRRSDGPTFSSGSDNDNYMSLNELNDLIFGSECQPLGQWVDEQIRQNEQVASDNEDLAGEVIIDRRGPTPGPGEMMVFSVDAVGGATITIVKPAANPDRLDVYVSGGVSTAFGASVAAGLTNNGPGLLEGWGTSVNGANVTFATGLDTSTGLPVSNGALGTTVTLISTPHSTPAGAAAEVNLGVYAGSISDRRDEILDARSAVAGARSENLIWRAIQTAQNLVTPWRHSAPISIGN